MSLPQGLAPEIKSFANEYAVAVAIQRRLMRKIPGDKDPKKLQDAREALAEEMTMNQLRALMAVDHMYSIFKPRWKNVEM
jgi:hypothetical protein